MQLWEGDRSNIANIGKPQEDADAILAATHHAGICEIGSSHNAARHARVTTHDQQSKHESSDLARRR